MSTGFVTGLRDTDAAPMAPALAENTRAFVRATEVWTLDQSTNRLTLASAFHGSMTGFAQVSDQESFGMGEGLPGRAWQFRAPVMLKGFRDSYFRRTEAAEREGLTVGLAIPVFSHRGELMGVVVFLCGDDAEHVGAIEIWHGGDESGDTMGLVDGYFGTAAHFEWISKRTRFPRGMGLPGQIWASGRPQLMHDLGNSRRFIRSESAEKAGLTFGIAFPVTSHSTGTTVLTLLSARGTPIARRFEIWSVLDRRWMKFRDGVCELEGTPSGHDAELLVRDGDCVLTRVAATGVPEVVADLSGSTDILERAAARAGFRSLVALPVHGSDGLSDVVAWYF